MNPYLIIATLVALLVSASGGYVKGHHDAAQAANVKSLTIEGVQLKTALDASIADAKTSRDIALAASLRQRGLEIIAAKSRADIETYRSTLHANPDLQNSPCVLSDLDVRWLRRAGGDRQLPAARPPATPVRFRPASADPKAQSGG